MFQSLEAKLMLKARLFLFMNTFFLGDLKLL